MEEIQSSPNTELSALMPVPNGTELFNSLVNRYMDFAKKSAENIIKLAATLLEAKSKLSNLELRDFCKKVGLEYDGSTYRKLIKIGGEVSRFEPFIERLPNSWTTVYQLATLDKGKFDRVAHDDRFSPTMTASEIKAILNDSASAVERVPTDCAISFGQVGSDKKLEMCRKLKQLADECGFTYSFSPKLDKELVPEPKRPNLIAYMNGEAA